ncbi:MAG: hypothetical protein ABS92_01685 [Thiobacillus sp. SCN 63-374]|nr:MAG: hypothetical protein ABS92_01685 [Thiobacillus sp. SCN 63-374]
MSMTHNNLFKLAYVWQLKHSRNGNPRWRFIAQSANGVFLEFQTVANAGSTSTCKLHGVAQSTLIKVAYHETPSGKLMADAWSLVSQQEAIQWDAAVKAVHPSQGPAITADSFEEWFEENVSDEDCQYFVDNGVDWDYFDKYGGVGEIYDRFDIELDDIATRGYRILVDALDECYLGSADGVLLGTVIRATELLAEDRLSRAGTVV